MRELVSTSSTTRAVTSPIRNPERRKPRAEEELLGLLGCRGSLFRTGCRRDGEVALYEIEQLHDRGLERADCIEQGNVYG